MTKRLFFLGVFALLVAVGCSSSNNNPGQDVQVDANQPLPDTCSNCDTEHDTGVTDTGQKCSLQVSLKGKAYLIQHLYVDKPAGEKNALATTLTNLWNNDIKNGRLVILFYVSKYDPQTGKATIQAGTGIKDTDGKYAFIKNPGPNDLQADINGCTFDTNVQGKIVMYPDTVTAQIPIVALDAHGVFTETANAINQGSLKGGICVSAAEKINFDPFHTKPPYSCQNFKKFMDLMKLSPDRHDLTGGICESGTDGYAFQGRFDAKEIKNFKTDLVDAPHNFKCTNQP